MRSHSTWLQSDLRRRCCTLTWKETYYYDIMHLNGNGAKLCDKWAGTFATVWALRKIWSYLYGANNINKFTESLRGRVLAEISLQTRQRKYRHRRIIKTLSHSNDETAHSKKSCTETILTVPIPLNTCMNQIILESGIKNSKTSKILFQSWIRHHIISRNLDNIFTQLKDCINPNVTYKNQKKTDFPAVKFVHMQKLVADIFNRKYEKN